MLWLKFPLVKLLFLYIVGILLFEWLNIQIQLTFIFGLVILLSTLLLILVFWSRLSIAPLVLIPFIFLLLGYGIHQKSLEKSSKGFEFHTGELKTILLLETVLKPNGKYFKYLASVYAVSKDERTEIPSFSVLLNLKKGSLKEQNAPIPGDLLTVQTSFYSINPPSNPAQFNYAGYLATKGIYHQAFANEWNRVDSISSFKRRSYLLQTELLRQFKNSSIQPENLSVLKALLLGDKTDLDSDMKSSFAAAGTMHVLAVSGLHVGIIYLIFYQLIIFLKFQKRVFLSAVILLSVVWSFAILSGLSTSVQRSAWMFSFIILAKPLKRESLTLNSVAASAFLILLIDPISIYDAGFQLSYSAVLGILLLYPKWQSLLNSSSKYLNKVSSLLLVSTAAQLSTLPFSFYYFHLFPTYFLLSNLFIIPLAFAIVSIGVISIFSILIFGKMVFIDGILNFLLSSMREIVMVISELPSAQLGPFWIEIETAIVLAGMIIGLIVYFQIRKVKYLLVSFSFLLVAFLIEGAVMWHRSKEREFTVYSFEKMNAWSFRDGLSAEVVVVDTLSLYESSIIRDHLSSLGISNYQTHSIYELVNCTDASKERNLRANFEVGFGQKRLLYVNQQLPQNCHEYDFVWLPNHVQPDELKVAESKTIFLHYSYHNELLSNSFYNLKTHAFISTY